MYDAILSSEDPRYYQHGGVDLIGTTRALLHERAGRRRDPGWLVDQPAVREERPRSSACETRRRQPTRRQRSQGRARPANCWTDATTADGTEGIQRKLQEMRYAIALEQKYSKNEILLGYLNIANFGGTTYGIDAAARYYFSVAAKDLTLAQAATLAGIVQNPNTYRIDKPSGSIFDADGVGYNKAPDGVDRRVSASSPRSTRCSPTARSRQEQYLAAADGYTSTKGRQLYVLEPHARRRQDHAGAVRRGGRSSRSPRRSRPPTTGCAAAGGAAYFCQYVKYIIKNDPAFGATAEDRTRAAAARRPERLHDARLPHPEPRRAGDDASTRRPRSQGMRRPRRRSARPPSSIEATTGRILVDRAEHDVQRGCRRSPDDPNYSSLVYAGDYKYGNSTGFTAGSTFKLFTLDRLAREGPLGQRGPERHACA